MIVLDSSVLVAYEVDRDINHERAVTIIKNIISSKISELVVSDYIFDETVTVTLIRSKSIIKAVNVGALIKSATNFIKINGAIFDEAWQIFANQEKTKFSFTDCTIMAMMKYNNITKLATFDNEFKKINWIRVVDS